MRTLLLATLAFAALTAIPLDVAPAAEAAAAPCVPAVPCPICVFSYYNEPGCIVPNPCDPRYCDVWIFDPSVLAPILP